MKICEKCGKPLKDDAIVCSYCGSVIAGGLSQPSFRTGFGDLSLPEMPTLDLPQVGGFALTEAGATPLPGAGVDLGDLQLDFTAGRLARGREYRIVKAIGRTADGEAQLVLPFSLFELADGHLYVIDFVDTSGRARVQLFDPAGDLSHTIRTFEVGDSPDTLDTPVGIVADYQGNFYISDMGASCIKKFSPSGQPIAVLGQEGIADDELNAPQDVDVDAAGNLYLADTDNNRVLKWSPGGRALLVLGINRGDPDDPEWLLPGDGPGEFDGPQGVTVDGGGHILVADTNNHRVQKFSPAGEWLFSFGEEGQDAGELSYPDDIQVDGEGNVFVSDLDGGRIQKFDPEGHFVYEVILPSDAGSAGDFEVGHQGHLFVALRKNQVVLQLEVE